MDARSRRTAGFPWVDLLPTIAVGIPSLLIALLCIFLLASYLGPQFDLVIINDHVIGGMEDQLTVMLVGSLFGASAVFCALRFWSRVGEWQRERERRVETRDS